MRKQLLLTLILCLALTSSVFASGVALTGIGARATALGGAFRGLSNDWSSMYWNPAGMTQISGMHFGFSGEMILLNLLCHQALDIVYVQNGFIAVALLESETCT